MTTIDPNAPTLRVASIQAFQAVMMTIYALHDSLVDTGAIPAEAVPEALDGFRAEDPKVATLLTEISAKLRERPFRFMTMRERLMVLDGGAGDADLPERKTP